MIHKLHQKTFYSDREEAFLKASAPKANFHWVWIIQWINLVLVHILLLLVKLFYWALAMEADPSRADNPNYSGINPQVPSDADGSVYVPEVFNYNKQDHY